MFATYTKKSNAARAAKAHFGPDAIVGETFILTPIGGGRWTFAAKEEPADETPAPETATAAPLPAPEAAPEAAAAPTPAPEAAPQADTPAPAPKAARGKAKAAAKKGKAAKGKAKAAAAPAAPKADAAPATAPREGTLSRRLFELMRRPGGATRKELCDEAGYQCGWGPELKRWAAAYGLTGTSEKVDGDVRYVLTAKEPAPANPTQGAE